MPSHLKEIDIVPVTYVAGRVEAVHPAEYWREPLKEGKIIIFRGAYLAAEMVALRQELLAWGRSTPVLPTGISASQRGLDYHRVDDGSVPTSMPHIFHQFGVARGGALPLELAEKIKALRHALLDWQNRLAGTNFDLDDDEFRFKALRHPCGGGYLVPHRHPYLPQKVAIFLNLSEPSVDYTSGAARFRNASGWVDTFRDFRCGDMLAWRYNLEHDVTPVESEKPLQWGGDRGLWIAAMERFETHPHSRAT